jgi:hypothetical protein
MGQDLGALADPTCRIVVPMSIYCCLAALLVGGAKIEHAFAQLGRWRCLPRCCEGYLPLTPEGARYAPTDHRWAGAIIQSKRS